MTDPGVAGLELGAAVLTTIGNYGIDTVFGIPGTHNLELYRHIRAVGLRAVTTRHESAAGYAADGWAVVTGRAGVVLTTSGPGLLNVLAAGGGAWCESRPLLVISPGPPSSGSGALHEVKDSVGAVDRVFGWSRRAGSAEDAIELVHQAFAGFASRRPRPVHIEIPLAILDARPTVALDLTLARSAPPKPRADPASLTAAADALGAAERPLLLVGGGAINAGPAVTELAERLAAPVVSTINGKGVVSERHPLAIGSELRFEVVRRHFAVADLVLVIGSKLGEAEIWDDAIETSANVVRVDIEQADARTTLAPDIVVIGDARDVIGELSARVPANHRPCWLDVATLREDVLTAARATGGVAMRLAEAVAAALPDDAILAGDSSRVVYVGATTAVISTEPRSFLYTPTYATLGYGLPAAVGAAIAAPGRPVVCFVGDGALQFAMAELATVIEQQLAMVLICADDGGYGEIRQNMLDRGIEPIAVDLAQPDWPALAGAFGWVGICSSVDSVGEDLAAALASGKPTLLHVPVGV